VQTTLPIIGKAILYAEEDFIAPIFLEFSQSHSPEPLPLLADIPPAGSKILSRHPICTVFATAQSEQECCDNLKQNVQFVRDRIGSGCQPHMTAQNQSLHSSSRSQALLGNVGSGSSASR